MTTKQMWYAAFICTWAQFKDRTKFISMHGGDMAYEFSYRPCDICKTGMGGSRYRVTMLAPNPKYGKDRRHKRPNTQTNLTVCQDCLYYAEYGTLDDMTMLELGEP